MAVKKYIEKNLLGSRLLKDNGSWIYCTDCNRTVGYLCYTTYLYFRLSFDCQCGSSGIAEIIVDKELEAQESNKPPKIIKNRYCCTDDESPLFSVVEKNIKGFAYEVICKECKKLYRDEHYEGTT